MRELMRKVTTYIGCENGYTVKCHPITNRERLVSLIFNTAEDMARSENIFLTWQRRQFYPTGWGPALDTRSRIVSVHLPDDLDMEEAANAFCKGCDASTIISHLWCCKSGPEGRPLQATFTGHVVGIVRVPPGPDEFDDAILTKEQCHLFPLWITINGKDHPTTYADRIETCRLCRSRYQVAHTRGECPTLQCDICGGLHKRTACPNRPQDDTANTPSFTDDESNTPPASESSHKEVAPGPSAPTDPTPQEGGNQPKTPPRNVTSPMGPPPTPGRPQHEATPATPGQASSSVLLSQASTNSNRTASTSTAVSNRSLLSRLSPSPKKTTSKGKGKEPGQLGLDTFWDFARKRNLSDTEDNTTRKR